MFKKLFRKESGKELPNQIIDLIEGVILKRKLIHLKYEGLIRTLSKSDRPILKKLSVSKYIMYRILRESDRAFVKAQIKASNLCSCKEKPIEVNTEDDQQPRVYH